jgi:voltage-gated sodium channel
LILRFEDYNRMKDKVLHGIVEIQPRVEDFYKEHGCFAGVAKSYTFAWLANAAILFNCIWIGFDAAWNEETYLYSADTLFIVVENVLCSFFALELFIRFGAFARKWDCFKDKWFVFDSLLSVIMASETWFLPLLDHLDDSKPLTGANSSDTAAVFRMARILKMGRLGRVVRLMQVFPHLLTQVKTITGALWSVAFTILLLGIIVYVFAVTFKQQTADAEATPRLNEYFPTLSATFWVLILQGVLIDGPTDIVKDAYEEEPLLAFLFMVFILISGFTILNMLIGIICTQVDTVYRREQNNKWTASLKSTLWELWDVYSEEDNLLDEKEFEGLIKNPLLRYILAQHGVVLEDLVALKRSIYESKDSLGAESSPVRRPTADKSEDGTGSVASLDSGCVAWSRCVEDPQLTFDEFVGIVLRLRSGNAAQVRDISNLREFMKYDIKIQLDPLREQLDRLCCERSCVTPPGIPSDASPSKERSRLPSDASQSLRAAANAGDEVCDAIEDSSIEMCPRVPPPVASQPPGSVAEQLAQLQAGMEELMVRQRAGQRELVARQDRLDEQLAQIAKELRVVRLAEQWALGIPVGAGAAAHP